MTQCKKHYWICPEGSYVYCTLCSKKGMITELQDGNA